MSNLPNDYAERKALPITTGVVDYFPDALAEVARVSRVGNEQHNPGQPLHWEKGKSTDHADALVRHLIDRGTVDIDGTRHSAKVAWRALAILQTEIEEERERSEDERSREAGHGSGGDSAAGRTAEAAGHPDDEWAELGAGDEAALVEVLSARRCPVCGVGGGSHVAVAGRDVESVLTQYARSTWGVD